MVSSMDVNKTTTDRIFQLGYGPNGKLSLSAGTGDGLGDLEMEVIFMVLYQLRLDFKYGREVVVRITNHLKCT